MAKGKRDGTSESKGPGTTAGGGNDIGNHGTPRAGRSKSRIIQVDAFVASPSPKPPKREAGLKKERTAKEAAGDRAGKKTGRPLDSERTPEVLPFEATLAYVFRNSGGKETAINAARLLIETDPRFKRLVYAYDSASEIDKKSIRLEDLCAAAEVTPDEFLGLTVPALWKRNTDMGRMLAAVSHPQIVETSIQMAKTPFGIKDRAMIFEHTGFLPTKSGPQINIDNSRKTLNVGKGQVEDTGAPALPSFEEDMGQIAGVVRDPNQKALPTATKEQEIVVPGEFEDVEEAEIVQ